MRQDHPPTVQRQQQQQLPSKKEETPEELKRKIALLERLARSRGLIA
jgi:5'-3' exonuclease